VAALEEWCRRGLEGYKGIKITNMSSSWRDGLAFCALIHRYRPDLMDFEILDPQDWTGNCSLAFHIAETQLGIPPLLDVEDVIRNESPDQFFIMTYVAQFYHKFTAPDSGYDSTLTTSFKYSSSEDDSPMRISSTGKRKQGGHNLIEMKRKRPLGLVVTGGLELRIDSPQEEKENPFKSDDCRNHENTLKTYDADDEEGESSEVVLRNIPGIMTEARNGTSGHQDLVLKRKRPNSLNRVSSSSMDKENHCKPKEIKNKTEKRGSKRMIKPKPQESVIRRKMIGISDFPKPYENKDISENESQQYFSERRRKRSSESAAYSNLYNQTSVRLRDTKDPLIERVKQVPLHIAESQKLLKTSIFQLKSPQYPTKCLILNIYKIKYDRRPSLSPAANCQYLENKQGVKSIPDPCLEQVQVQPNKSFQIQPSSQETESRIPSPTPNTRFEHIKVRAPSMTNNTNPIKRQRTMQATDCTMQPALTRPEHFKIKHQQSMQSNMSGHTVRSMQKHESPLHKYETPIDIHETTSLNHESTTQKFETAAHRFELAAHKHTTPIQKYETSAHNYESPAQKYEIATNGYETMKLNKETEIHANEIPTQITKLEQISAGNHQTPKNSHYDDRSQKHPVNYDNTDSPTPKHTHTEQKIEAQTPHRQFEHFSIQTPRHGNSYQQFKSQTLTPRSRSKYEHLIKNLKESQDDNLVIYKVLEPTPCKPATNPPVTPYKEPKDKYTIEYLWNIGATNFQTRRPTRKCH